MAKRQSRPLATFWNGDTAETMRPWRPGQVPNLPTTRSLRMTQLPTKKDGKRTSRKMKLSSQQGYPKSFLSLEHFCIETTMTWGIPPYYYILILSTPETRPSLSFRTGKFWKIKVPSSSPIVWGQGEKRQTS